MSQKITTFLTFDGKAEEAVNFYTSVFKRSKIVSTSRYTDAGPGPKGAFMLATFELEGQTFVALNGGPDFKFSMGISLVVNCESQEEVDYYWAKLSDGGKEVACGWVTDRFGVSWQVVPTAMFELLNGKDQAGVARAMTAMMKMVKLDLATLQRAYEGK